MVPITLTDRERVIERLGAIRRALAHSRFYNGDMGADIRWLLAIVEQGQERTRHGGNLLIPYYLQQGQPEPEYDQGHSVVVWYDDLYDLKERVANTLDDELLSAAKRALSEMCNTVAPRHSFTDVVDALDQTITKVELRRRDREADARWQHATQPKSKP